MDIEMLEVPKARLLGFDAAAGYLNVKPRTIRRLMERGLLPAVHIPHLRRVLFDRCDLDRLIEDGKGGDNGAETAMPLAAVREDDHGEG